MQQVTSSSRVSLHVPGESRALICPALRAPHPYPYESQLPRPRVGCVLTQGSNFLIHCCRAEAQYLNLIIFHNVTTYGQLGGEKVLRFGLYPTLGTELLR